MHPTIETLESRKLLSGSGAVAVLLAEGLRTKAEFKALEATGKANFKLIESDLKDADEFKSSGALLKRLGDGATTADSALSRAINATGTLISGDVKKVEAAAKALARKPTSASLQAKLSAVDNKLGSDAASKLSIISADITSQHDTDQTNVDALLAANPGNTQLKTDVDTTISASAGAGRSAVSNSATTALTTDVSAVIAAFPA